MTVNPSAEKTPQRSGDVFMNEGKGFGGGEATRDPEPTEIDPNDPKGKQQAIHKADSFADYLAKRKASGDGVIGERSGDVKMSASVDEASPTSIRRSGDVFMDG